MKFPFGRVGCSDRARVAAGYRDAAVARTASVAEDSIELDMDVLILIVAAEQGNRLATGSGDGEAANRDELGLLQTDRVVACASAGRSRQNNLPGLRDRISFNDDSVDLGSTLEIVLAVKF